MADAWVIVLGGLPVLAAVLAAATGRGWSSRRTPADAFRVVTGVAFAGWVDPTLGVLAGLAAIAWWREQWELAAGGTFWPMLAAAVWLGREAHPLSIQVLLILLLAAGLLQVNLALWQRWRGHPIAGTIGHRTGLGLFLAILTPLGFLTPFGPVLAVLFGAGVGLSASVVASAAWATGLLLVQPSWWPLVGVVALGGILMRLIKVRPGIGFGLRHWGDTGRARLATWRFALTSLSLRRPDWLIGWGTGSFALHARRVDHGHREIFREAHNDYLEFLFEHGALGVAAGAWWFWRFGVVALGDPLTGATAAVGVGALAQFPLRVAPVAMVGFLVAVLLMRRVPGWA